jgi:hypothetical protein
MLVTTDWLALLTNILCPQPTILGSNTEDGVPFQTYNPDGVNVTAAFQTTLAYFFCPVWKSAT